MANPEELAAERFAMCTDRWDSVAGECREAPVMY